MKALRKDHFFLMLTPVVDQSFCNCYITLQVFHNVKPRKNMIIVI